MTTQIDSAALASPATETAQTFGQAGLASGSSALDVLGALVLVVALIIAVAWVLRRTQSMKLGGQAAMKVLASLPIGPRERLLLVEAVGTQLLIAVAPGNVRTLHVFAPGTGISNNAAMTDSSSPEQAFATRLKSMLQMRDSA